jgi:hypothetical protein
MRAATSLPPALADEHTLIAQRYAGFFLGHPYRAAQQKTGPGAIVIDWNRGWREPAVVSDGCDFCARLTDDEAVRRVAGYQHAIDIEVLRPYALLYSEWLRSGSPDVVEREEVDIAGVVQVRGTHASQANRRRFIELHLDTLAEKPCDMTQMPLRLKRKLCIEWNHLYRDWLRENPDISYDFEAREFYRELASIESTPRDEPKEWWHDMVAGNPFTGGAA